MSRVGDGGDLSQASSLDGNCLVRQPDPVKREALLKRLREGAKAEGKGLDLVREGRKRSA